MSTIERDWAIPAWTIGDRLRKARQHAGISREDMAEALLRNRNTITNYEYDRTTPPKRVMARWADLCSVPLEWLELGDAQSPGPSDGPGAPALYPPWDSNPEPAGFPIVALTRAIAA